MAMEANDYNVIHGRGRLEAGHFASEAEYGLHVDPCGRPLFVQFEEHPDNLADGTIVRLTLEDGRVVHCQVLGDSPLCTIVGHT
jgi:hypothetical protein